MRLEKLTITSNGDAAKSFANVLASVFGAVALLLSCTIPALAETTLSFASVCDRALEHSYDLALSAIDTRLARNKVHEAMVPFLPTLNGCFNTEYVGSLEKQNTLQNQQAVVVGNSILPGNTRFQQAATLNTNYTVADFGVRWNQLKAAKQHARSTELQQNVHARDLRLEVLDAYTQALLTFKQVKSKERQIQLASKLYEVNTRLWHAGKISRIELGEQAIGLKNAETELSELRQTLGENLNKLTSYTQEPYYVPSVILTDIDCEPAPSSQPFIPSNTPDFKAYELLIKEKSSELRSLRAQRYPQVVAFTNFVMYGSNGNDLVASVGALRPRAMYFGIGLQMPIFDGFKTRVAVEGKKLEMARLATERDKRLWELHSDYQKSATAASLYSVELSTRAELVSNSQEQLGMVIRMTESQVMERSKALAEQIDLVKRQLEEDTTRTKRLAAVKRLRIYSEI